MAALRLERLREVSGGMKLERMEALTEVRAPILQRVQGELALRRLPVLKRLSVSRLGEVTQGTRIEAVSPEACVSKPTGDSGRSLFERPTGVVVPGSGQGLSWCAESDDPKYAPWRVSSRDRERLRWCLMDAVAMGVLDAGKHDLSFSRGSDPSSKNEIRLRSPLELKVAPWVNRIASVSQHWPPAALERETVLTFDVPGGWVVGKQLGPLKIEALWRGAPLKHHRGVTALALASDDGVVASAGADESIRLWQAPSGDLRGVMASPDGVVQALSFFAGDSLLLVGDDRAMLRVWRVADQKMLSETQLAEPAVSVLPFCRRFVAFG